MKRIFWLATALLAATSISHAADLPTKAPVGALAPQIYSWTGFYVGVNGGGGWSDPGGSLATISAGLAGLPAAALPSAYTMKASGALGGVQAGYNYQSGNYLGGIELDIQGSSIDGTATSSFPGAFPFAASNNGVTSDTTWFATFRARAGLTFDRILVYATGGLAVAHVKDTVFNNFTTPVNLFGTTSTTRSGWTAGGGLEYAFNANWSLKAEYLYMDVGSATVTATDPINFPGGFATYSFRHRYDLARGGLNYRF